MLAVRLTHTDDKRCDGTLLLLGGPLHHAYAGPLPIPPAVAARGLPAALAIADPMCAAYPMPWRLGVYHVESSPVGPVGRWVGMPNAPDT